MTEKTVDLQALRAAFPPEYVGKLPRVTCQKCSQRGVDCDQHHKTMCAECGNYLGRHIHLDYVGHADVTIRLLEVDPEWSWAPKATDPDPEMLKAALASGDPEIVRMVIENGPPKFETDKTGSPVGLWIKLTVGDVTRLGFGSCPANQNDAEKVLIGDALRNAAMRFGVAVDLWAKGDRADPTAENATASAGQVARGHEAAGDAFENARPGRQPQRPGTSPIAAVTKDEAWLDAALEKAADETMTADGCRELWKESAAKVRTGDITKADATRIQDLLRARLDDLGREAKGTQDEPAQQPETGLDPEDPWAVRVEALADDEEATAALRELKEMFGSGKMDQDRANRVFAAIRARFPQAASEARKAA